MDPKSFLVIVPVLIFMIPIIAILTNHQQKMAELIHGKKGSVQPNDDLQALRQDLARLQSTVSALAINVDNLRDEVRGTSGIQERVRTGE